MIKKVIRFFILSFLISFLGSCVSKNYQFGQKSDFYDKADSLKSLQAIKEIKTLDFSDFSAGKFQSGKTSVNYRFLKPEKINPDKKYPLIVVFHGFGAIGVDNVSQLGVLSRMWLSPKNRKKYPSYVLSIQFPVRSSNYHLDKERKVLASESNEYLDLVLKSVDSLLTKENINRNQIYVMGFSMGGATTSNAISKRPDLFAAAINVSGISQFDHIQELTNMPVLIVHGSLDTDNYPQSNLRFFDELKSNGKVIFWEYKDKYHNNILSEDFINRFPKWLFKQNKYE